MQVTLFYHLNMDILFWFLLTKDLIVRLRAHNINLQEDPVTLTELFKDNIYI